MRTGLLALGAILLVIGVPLFLYGFTALILWSIIKELAASGIITLSNPENYYEAITVLILGDLMAVIGLVLCIYGAVAEPNKLREDKAQKMPAKVTEKEEKGG